MARVDVKAEVTVYETDDGDCDRSEDKIGVETYWNDISGRFATLVIGRHRYTVTAQDLRAALTAVTTR